MVAFPHYWEQRKNKLYYVVSDLWTICTAKSVTALSMQDCVNRH